MSGPTCHVMFSPSAAGALKQALSLAKRPDEVLCPFDDFSFGPIATEVAEDRIQWVEEVLGYTGWEDITASSQAFLAAFEVPKISVTAWVSRRQTQTYAGFLWWLSHTETCRSPSSKSQNSRARKRRTWSHSLIEPCLLSRKIGSVTQPDGSS